MKILLNDTLPNMRDKLITITLAKFNGRRDLAAKALGMSKNRLFQIISERTNKNK